MRFNMDPTGKVPDSEIERVLLEAKLDETILKKKKEAEEKKKEQME